MIDKNQTNMNQYYLKIDGLYVNSFKLELSKRDLIATAHSNARAVMIDRDGAEQELFLLRAAFPEGRVNLYCQDSKGESTLLL